MSPTLGITDIVVLVTSPGLGEERLEGGKRVWRVYLAGAFLGRPWLYLWALVLICMGASILAARIKQALESS